MTATELKIAPQLPQYMTDLVRKGVMQFVQEGDEQISLIHVIDCQTAFNRMGPYEFCKKYDLLVNNSGEDFAIEFMTYINQIWPCTY